MDVGNARVLSLRAGTPAASLTLLLLFLLAPTLAPALGGFHGFYVAYTVLGILVALSLPLVVWNKGLSAFSACTSLSLALAIVTVFTALGFAWGFSARVWRGFLPTLTSFALLVIRALSIEVPRGLLVSSLGNRKHLAVALSVIVGLFLGNTIPAIVSYVVDAISLANTAVLVKDVAYSLALSLLHGRGGFVPAVLFRLVVDSYWYLSPIVPDTTRAGSLWNCVAALTYSSAAALVLYEAESTRLSGLSKRALKQRGLRRSLGIVVDGAAYALATALAAMLYFGIMPVVIVSSSMSPTLNVGDLVLVIVRRPLELSEGDIIAFRLGKSLVIHRVIEVIEEGDKFKTKGDAATEPDPFTVPRESVLGKVIGCIPRLGSLVLALREGLGKLAGAILASMASMVVALRALRWLGEGRARIKP